MMKAMVLLSGGIDSATALWLLKKREFKTYALTFKFGKSNKNEIKASRKLAKKADVEKHFVIDVNFLKQISELNQLKNINLPPVYIPSRNTIFFGIASHYAEILGANYIVTGHSSIDPFPDSKPKYVKAINRALKHGSWLGKKYNIEIIMPISKLDKTSIVKLALELKIPLELTWSCYKNYNFACGKCSGCISRLNAFEELGIKDVIRYKRE